MIYNYSKINVVQSYILYNLKSLPVVGYVWSVPLKVRVRVRGRPVDLLLLIINITVFRYYPTPFFSFSFGYLMLLDCQSWREVTPRRGRHGPDWGGVRLVKDVVVFGTPIESCTTHTLQNVCILVKYCRTNVDLMDTMFACGTLK